MAPDAAFPHVLSSSMAGGMIWVVSTEKLLEVLGNRIGRFFPEETGLDPAASFTVLMRCAYRFNPGEERLHMHVTINMNQTMDVLASFMFQKPPYADALPEAPYLRSVYSRHGHLHLGTDASSEPIQLLHRRGAVWKQNGFLRRGAQQDSTHLLRAPHRRPALGLVQARPAGEAYA